MSSTNAVTGDRLLTLEEWANRNFNNPPSLWTLRGMARNGYFDPPAVKLGKSYYVASTVRVVDPARPLTLVDRLRGA